MRNFPLLLLALLTCSFANAEFTRLPPLADEHLVEPIRQLFRSDIGDRAAGVLDVADVEHWLALRGSMQKEEGLKERLRNGLQWFSTRQLERVSPPAGEEFDELSRKERWEEMVETAETELKASRNENVQRELQKKLQIIRYSWKIERLFKHFKRAREKTRSLQAEKPLPTEASVEANYFQKIWETHVAQSAFIKATQKRLLAQLNAPMEGPFQAQLTKSMEDLEAARSTYEKSASLHNAIELQACYERVVLLACNAPPTLRDAALALVEQTTITLVATGMTLGMVFLADVALTWGNGIPVQQKFQQFLPNVLQVAQLLLLKAPWNVRAWAMTVVGLGAVRFLVGVVQRMKDRAQEGKLQKQRRSEILMQPTLDSLPSVYPWTCAQYLMHSTPADTSR